MPDLIRQWAVAERLARQAEDLIQDVLVTGRRPTLETQRVANELRLKADEQFQVAFNSLVADKGARSGLD